jgi:endonuclease G, mitochondrial
MRKLINLILLLAVGCTPAASLNPSPPSQPPQSNPCPIHLPKGLPTGEPIANDTIISRDIYCLAADPDTKFATFVAYRLDAQTIGTSGADTDREWQADPDLNPDITLEPEDYKGAYKTIGVDRGHLAPLASFKGVNWQETNYLSNIVPQDSGFNRGVWADLEDYERELDREKPTWIITGTAYLEKMPQLPNADEAHIVPSALWKILITNEGTEAFYFEQYTTATDYRQGAASLETIESMTGLDFP